MGTRSLAMVARRRAWRRSSTAISSSPTNFSRMASSTLAMVSMSSARYSSAWATRSDGISWTDHFAPSDFSSVASSQTRASMVSRSTTPL